MVNKKNGWMHRHTGDRKGAGIRGERKALWGNAPMCLKRWKCLKKE